MTWRGLMVFCFILLGIPAIGIATAEWLRISYIDQVSFASAAAAPTSIHGENWRYVLDAFRGWHVHTTIYGHCTSHDSVIVLRYISVVALAIGALQIIAISFGRRYLKQNSNFETTARPSRLVLAVVLTAATFVLPGVVVDYGICVVGGIAGRQVYYVPIILVAIGWLAFVRLVMRAAFSPQRQTEISPTQPPTH